MTEALLVSVGPKAVAVLAFLALGALAAKRRRPSAAVFALFLAALAARLLLNQKGPLVFYDEYEHLDLARNLAGRGVFAGTMGFIPGRLTVDRLPLWPPLAHLHYAALFLLRGFSEQGVYALNAVLSSLAVLVSGAPVAAALLAFNSTAIQYAGTADLASVNLLWSALAWWAAIKTEDDASPAALWAAGLAGAAALHGRPDGFLLVPPLAFLLAKHGRKAAGPIALLLLSAVPLAALALSARSGGHDGYRDALSVVLARMPRQALDNAGFFLEPERLVLLALAVAGAWAAPLRRSTWALLLSLPLYFTLYAAFANSPFQRGSGDKYALQLILPLALLAGRAELRSLPALLALCGLLGMASVPRARDTGYADADAFLREVAPNMDGRPVLSFVPPAPRVVLDVPVLHPVLLLENAPERLDPEGKGFLVMRDEAWEKRPEDAARVDALLKTLYDERELVAETAHGRRRALSSLTPKR